MKYVEAIITVITFVSIGMLLIDLFTGKSDDKKKDPENSYSFWSVVSGILMAFPVLIYEWFRSIFWPRRK